MTEITLFSQESATLKVKYVIFGEGKPMSTVMLTKLFETGRRRSYLKNQIIDFSDSDAFYMLEEGYVKRYLITKEGETDVQSVYGPGQFFPLTPVFSRVLHYNLNGLESDKTYIYQSMTDIRLSIIKIDELSEACAMEPLLYHDLLVEAGRRLRSNIHLLDSQSLRTARWRVVHQLVYLANEFGEEVEEGVRITIPITHQDLANMLTLRRETISRIMVRLQEQGYLVPSKDIIIRSIDELKAIYS